MDIENGNENSDTSNEDNITPVDNSNEGIQPEESTVNPLDVPDDEFDAFISANINLVEEPENIVVEDKIDVENTSTDSVNVEANEVTTDTNEIEKDSNDKSEVTEDKDIFSDKDNTKSKKEDKKPSTTDTDNTSDAINYKKEYEKLLTPFRANNRDIQVKDITQARRLMQMGANYNKKMEGLKPSLKIVKMLDNHDLLDETKINYLIDLAKNNPDAITKLIKESGIDVETIDTDTKNEYKPNTYTVDDKEVALDLALNDIQDTPSFKNTIEVISTKWDESSRQVAINNPALIKTINDHMEQGIYDKINNAVEQRRMFGEFEGIPDLQAYIEVGKEIQANGGFAPEGTKETPAKDVTTSKTKKDDSKLKKQKKAAAITKGSPSNSSINEDFNPLSMSDEEYEKIAGSNKFF